MKNWKIPPKDTSIVKYIDCYWFIEKTPSDSGPEQPKLNPDPAAHLILSDSQQYYQYEQDPLSVTGHGCHLILPHCKTLVMDHSRPFVIMGIKFHVGALYSLPALTDQIALDQIMAVDIKTYFNAEIDVNTLPTGQPETCRDLLDELLIPCLLDSREDKHSNLVRKSLSALANTPIAELSAALACSQRTIERSFSRVTGLTLKQYQSMNRLETILNYLYELPDQSIDWSDIAARFGFSDQPHLIRHLKSSIGVTPSHYAKQRDFAIDAYGNFE